MKESVEKTLHTKIKGEPLDASGLPLYLRGLYSLERWTAFGVPFAMAFPLETPTVKTMVKHREALETILGIPVAFALEDATSYRIERTLEAGLSFVAPDRQVYLPFLGVALAAGGGRTGTGQRTVAKKLSPQAQRLALMSLYSDLDGVSVTLAANLLGVTKMTASRAFNELEAAVPQLVAAEGRHRVLRPGKDKMALWQQLKTRLSSPVVRTHRLEYVPEAGLPLGGVSALCEVSMLQDNPWPTLAATRAQERALGLTTRERPDVPDDADDPACIVQVVRYELVPAAGRKVDPLSAILSLTDSERADPRVAGEIESAINRVLGREDEGNR